MVAEHTYTISKTLHVTSHQAGRAGGREPRGAIQDWFSSMDRQIIGKRISNNCHCTSCDFHGRPWLRPYITLSIAFESRAILGFHKSQRLLVDPNHTMRSCPDSRISQPTTHVRNLKRAILFWPSRGPAVVSAIDFPFALTSGGLLQPAFLMPRSAQTAS